MADLLPQPDAKKTLMRAFAILALLVVALSGLGYTIWCLWAPHH